MIAFGPIPSRRLGLSLGINNIVSRKVCTYNCVYCQIGQTKNRQLKRESFYEPEYLIRNVKEHLDKLDLKHQPDFLTFVANGEPTLDINLGDEIKLLQDTFLIPVAIISNASLMADEKVQNELMHADWVSLKVDSLESDTWTKINRPYPGIDLDGILQGIERFAGRYQGRLHTETMLVDRLNDHESGLEATSAFIAKLHVETAYLSIPTRPPAEKTVKAITPENIAKAWQIFNNKGINTENLTGFEGTNTGYTGNAYEDILNITAVHPLRDDTLNELLKKEKAGMEVIESLMTQHYLIKNHYNGHDYYTRNYYL
ncbi:radical SAM protein [Roseimarinus sediminis]|uniref:radical SAM protein n=1 Tax=Roseimarinus sediminis TaxID=1610899 RepID=UPI003D203111